MRSWADEEIPLLKRLHNGLVFFAACATGVVVVFMAISIDYEVVMRYLFVRPTSWVTDFCTYFILYICFLGTAWVLASEGHIKLEILLSVLSPKVQRVMNIITSLVGALVCATLFWYSLDLTIQAFQTNSLFVRQVLVPRWLVYMVIPFGCLLLSVEFGSRAWRYAKQPKVLGKERR